MREIFPTRHAKRGGKRAREDKHLNLRAHADPQSVEPRKKRKQSKLCTYARSWMEEYTKGISASHSNSSNTPGQKAKKDFNRFKDLCK